MIELDSCSVERWERTGIYKFLAFVSYVKP